jgi:predicted amidohydrolase
LVLRADAVTSGTYVISANRPAPTPDGLIGGPSIAISPTSEVLLETTDPMSVVTLRREVVEGARTEYPGYLKTYPGLYAKGWQQVDGEE